jgi:uncharacterized surface anchored protein
MKDKQVTFKKTDVAGQEIEGAHIVVKDEDGNIVDEWISTDKEHEISGLEEGKTYTLIETQAPDGYVISESIDFEVTPDKQDQYIEMKDKIVTFTKTDVTGEKEIAGAHIVVTDKSTGKVVDEFDSTDSSHNINGLIENHTYILSETVTPKGYVTAESIEFTVTNEKVNQTVTMKDKQVTFKKTDVAGQEIEGAHIVVKDKDGNIIDEWDSTKESHAIVGLEEGKNYTLIETQAPDGYVISESIDFEVTTDKKDQYIEMKDKIVTFTKTDVTGEKEIAGAHIVVTDKETGKIADEFDSTETSHNIKGLIEGHTYILRETVTPKNYVTAESIEFTVTNEKVDQSVNMKDKQVIFKKTDVAGKEVEGAHIIVKDKDGTIVDEWDSTKEEHIIEGLVEGETYTLEESTTPKGYVTAETITFTVTTDKENQYIEMKDKRVTISKQDAVTGKELPGAKLTLTEKDTGKEIESWTSSNTPHTIDNLVEGKSYILTEVSAPDGYEIAEAITFTVDYEKQDQEIVMKDAPYTAIQVNKVNKATNQPVVSRDFQFTMYADEECTQVIETVHANTEDGTATFEKVGFGTFYFKETAAPLGYLLSDEVKKIVVDENLEGVGDIHSFVYYNSIDPYYVEFEEPTPTTPTKRKKKTKTGDETNIAIYATASIVALAVIAIVVIKKKKED